MNVLERPRSAVVARSGIITTAPQAAEPGDAEVFVAALRTQP